MNRFIAILWNDLAAQEEAEARVLAASIARARPDWQSRWSQPGVAVLEAPWRNRAEHGLALGDQALFIGAVFSGDRRALAGDIDVNALVRSKGAHAVKALWGRYVLLVRDLANRCVHLVRDPSGALPCFVARRAKLCVFFSNPDDVEALGLNEARVDWSYLGQRLWNNRVVTTRTGLEDVRALAPGEVARVGQGRLEIASLWSPAAFVREHLSEPKAPGDALERPVVDVCKAWASCFDRLGLRLSGGLDSSIVLGCLPREQMHAINFVTPTPEGDERVFARAAAEFSQIPLFEALRDPACVDLARAVQHKPTLNPHLWLADGETDAIEAAFARDQSLDAIFSGRGGDNVFYRSLHPHVLADWLVAHGMGPGFMRRALAYARETGRPLLRSAREALAMNSRSDVLGEPAHALLLAPRLRDQAQAECAPVDQDLAPGKRLHVRMIEDRLNYFDHRAHADYIYPLVSQPVLEACLAMPSYVLSPAGADRGLARRAFAVRISPKIGARRSKGQTGAYLAQILLGHRRFLETFLCDGALMGAKMVEPVALRYALSEEGIARLPQHMPAIVGLLSVEAWLRNPPGGVKLT